MRIPMLALMSVGIGLISCVAAWPGTARIMSPEVIARAQETLQKLRDAHLDVELELEHPMLRDRMSLEVWHIRPDRVRLEILESGQVNYKGIVAASVGNEGWCYYPNQNIIEAGQIDAVEPAIVYDIVRSALVLLFGESKCQISLAKTSHVGVGDAIELDFPQPQSTCQLWLTFSDLLPRKLHCEVTSLGSYTLTVREAAYNVGLTEDLFDPNFLPLTPYQVNPIE